jgi:hypothetical protein
MKYHIITTKHRRTVHIELHSDSDNEIREGSSSDSEDTVTTGMNGGKLINLINPTSNTMIRGAIPNKKLVSQNKFLNNMTSDDISDLRKLFSYDLEKEKGNKMRLDT